MLAHQQLEKAEADIELDAGQFHSHGQSLRRRVGSQQFWRCPTECQIHRQLWTDFGRPVSLQFHQIVALRKAQMFLQRVFLVAFGMILLIADIERNETY